MAKIKSFTDIEQSTKLAEILPIESADMYWDLLSKDKYAKVNNIGYCLGRTCVYAWSLAALLEIIKKLVGYSLQSLDTNTVFMSCELGDKPYNIETENYDNPVDACVAMIIKLHEQNLL